MVYQDLFLEYMERAESFVNSCTKEGSAEMIPVVSTFSTLRYGVDRRVHNDAVTT